MAEQHKCAGYCKSTWHSYPCLNNGIFFEEGTHWCGVHAPSKVKARRDKAEKERQKERELDDARAAVAEAKEALVEDIRIRIKHLPNTYKIFKPVVDCLDQAEATLAELKAQDG